MGFSLLRLSLPGVSVCPTFAPDSTQVYSLDSDWERPLILAIYWKLVRKDEVIITSQTAG